MALHLNEAVIIRVAYFDNPIKFTCKSLRACGPALAKHKGATIGKRGMATGRLNIQGANNNLFAAVVTDQEGIEGLTVEPPAPGWWKDVPSPLINAFCDRLNSVDDEFEDRDDELTEEESRD